MHAPRARDRRGPRGRERQRAAWTCARVLRALADCSQDIGRLRQNHFLETRRVGDRGVEGGDPQHRRVEVCEPLLPDTCGQLGAESARQLVLVRHDDTTGLADGLADRVPVEWHQRAQVDDAHADVLPLGLLRREERALDERAPGNHGDVATLAANRGAREGNRVIGPGIGALVVGLAVQVLVLEEQHRIVAADGRAEQTRRIERIGRIDNPQARAVGEDALARLRVIRAPRRADSRRSARESPSGTRTRCSTGTGASSARRGSASSPARCSRRTGSRRPASARASPGRSRARRCWPRRAAS